MARIKIINNTMSNNLMIIIDKKLFYVKKNDSVFVDVSKCDVPIKIIIDRRNKIGVKWFNFIFTEPISSDARSIVCFDYKFVAKIDKDDCEFILCDNNYRDSNSLKLISVRVMSSRDIIYGEEYSLSTKNKSPKTKYILLQMIFLSGLPWVLAGIIYSFFDFEIELIFAIIILFLIGTVPSIKSIKKFNKALKNANDLLNTNIVDRCDYDKIEHITNKMIKDDNTKGVMKWLAKLLKYLIDSV